MSIEPPEVAERQAWDLSDDLAVQVRVARYLRQHYAEEESEPRAAIHALRAVGDRWRERYGASLAFRALLTAQWSEGLLTELVRLNAGRQVEDDVEARAFLERVFQDSALNLAVNFDALR